MEQLLELGASTSCPQMEQGLLLEEHRLESKLYFRAQQLVIMGRSRLFALSLIIGSCSIFGSHRKRHWSKDLTMFFYSLGTLIFSIIYEKVKKSAGVFSS